MKFFERFSLTKLCAALPQKDWKEVEKQQNKLGLEQFLSRRGIGSRCTIESLSGSSQGIGLSQFSATISVRNQGE